MLFEEMGLTYLGPYDGHNIDQLTRAFREAKQVNGAVLVHVCTQKGQGYEPADASSGQIPRCRAVCHRDRTAEEEKSKGKLHGVFSLLL